MAKFGIWRLDAQDRTPEALDAQIEELLSSLTKDLTVWAALRRKCELDLICGIFLSVTNEGFSISPESAKALGERDIEIGFDIYGPIEEARRAD